MAPRDPSSPLERLLDLAVYGPIGLALSAKAVLPQWIEEGRRQVGTQLTMARAVGRLAVGQGPRQATEVVRRVADQAESVLTGLGLVPDAGTRTATRNVGAAADARAEGDGGPRVRAVPEPSTAAPPDPPGPAPAASGVDPAQLAIPGYDTLSASQVVQRLPGLSPDELEAVRLHEIAGRSRKTVLLKVAQLRQGA